VSRKTLRKNGGPRSWAIREENGGKIMAGKITKTSHDFAPHDFAKSCILTLSVSPQDKRAAAKRRRDFSRKGTQRTQRQELMLFFLCDLCVLLWPIHLWI
jgi:hypothetical protein